MFTRSKLFINAWAGAFFANMLPQSMVMSKMGDGLDNRNARRVGKGKGRSSPPARNAAAHKRAAKKAKGRAINKARHA